jgi:hypothetical protein
MECFRLFSMLEAHHDDRFETGPQQWHINVVQ